MFWNNKLYAKMEKLVDLLETNIDENEVSELKAAALKRRVEFLVGELEIIQNQKTSLIEELNTARETLEALQKEAE